MARTGERKTQILQVLAHMLEKPASEKVTTAALAARLDVSEAALYRHFTGKAQMFEGLIEFIEQTLFALINKITTEEKSGARQLEAMVSVMLGFAQKNRGMTRVLIGDAPAQQALIDALDNSKAGFNSTHFRPSIETARRLRSNRAESLVDFPSRLLLQMMSRTAPDTDSVIRNLEKLLAVPVTTATA